MLPKCYESVSKVLRKCCERVAKVLQKCCVSVSKAYLFVARAVFSRFGRHSGYFFSELLILFFFVIFSL